MKVRDALGLKPVGGRRSQRRRRWPSRSGKPWNCRAADEDRAAQGSDLQFKPASKPILRIHGHLEVQDDFPLVTREFIDAMAETLLGERRPDMPMEGPEMDLGYMLPGVGRFRCNLFLAMGEVRGVFRHVPERIPAFHELHLPKVLERLSMERRGMILVTGITGSGKSTSLASMIDFMNRSRNDHIVSDRGPDRVRAPGQEVRDEPARDRPRLGELRPGPPRRPP